MLDEPTSSVDSTNEVKIYQNLFKEFKDKCLISSIHRLHLLRFFDHIYVFKKGEIVEDGSFSILSKKDGHLSKMLKDYEKE